VLSWLGSFLTDRSQRVAYAGELSVLVELLFGVPQGSVLGPLLLFLLYMADLFEVIAKHGARAHFYADDGQLYVSAPALQAEDTIRQFTDCLCEVEAWMHPSRLQLIWLGSRQQLDELNITDVQLLSTTLRPQSAVRSLGVILDSQLTMSSHITSLCRCAIINCDSFVVYYSH